MTFGINHNDSLLRGANTSTAAQANPENKRRDLIAAAVLVDHPEEGLILFETGCAENIDLVGSSSN